MITKLPFLFMFMVIFSYTNAGAPDNQSIPYPRLLPDVSTLYFNQEIDFVLSGTKDVFDHIEFNRGKAEVTDKGFKLSVDYANIPNTTEVLKVYLRDEKGQVKLAFTKEMALQQKLSEKHFGSVGYDKDLFKLDDDIQPLENAVSKQVLLNYHTLKLNILRFDQESISLSSFDMEIETAKGTSTYHSANGDITDEMKDAIKNMADGETVTFRNIITTYIENKQPVKMPLNYHINYTIGNPG